jgi:hypothetical protein
LTRFALVFFLDLDVPFHHLVQLLVAIILYLAYFTIKAIMLLLHLFDFKFQLLLSRFETNFFTKSVSVFLGT